MRALSTSLVFACLVFGTPGGSFAEGLLDPLPSDHWSRGLLNRLRFPGQAPPSPRIETRMDAALHLARWVERGLPSPEARPRLLTADFLPELRSLGIAPELIQCSLDSRDATSSTTAPPDLTDLIQEDSSPLQKATRKLLLHSLSELDRIEGKIERLRAEDRVKPIKKANP